MKNATNKTISTHNRIPIVASGIWAVIGSMIRYFYEMIQTPAFGRFVQLGLVSVPAQKSMTSNTKSMDARKLFGFHAPEDLQNSRMFPS